MLIITLNQFVDQKNNISSPPPFTIHILTSSSILYTYIQQQLIHHHHLSFLSFYIPLTHTTCSHTIHITTNPFFLLYYFFYIVLMFFFIIYIFISIPLVSHNFLCQYQSFILILSPTLFKHFIMVQFILHCYCILIYTYTIPPPIKKNPL
ncbi:hypothetical protein BDA99DRAFT_115625 [Phascolomyces articulosus]|uniref:Uncharacterized protein n=1 Tax=Phascolomyces articulosus TaxID=60185 RepID=A0AAD5KNT4_9FUNG|nr:hypothetical protein BDA99DRAFT_115625 [Phascolomyces articulosus]